jgi:hypothetical protein
MHHYPGKWLALDLDLAMLLLDSTNSSEFPFTFSMFKIMSGWWFGT